MHTSNLYHYFDFCSVLILGNLLQTVSPQSTLNYILGRARVQKIQSGMAESGLVKGKISSARAGGLGTDSQGMGDPGAGWGHEDQVGTSLFWDRMVGSEAESIR